MSSLSSAALFIEKAKAVSITVSEVASMQDAFAYAVALCAEKEPFQNLLPEGVHNPAVAGQPEGLAAGQKILAAPGFTTKDITSLQKLGQKAGLHIMSDNLRSCLAGLDVSLSLACCGIAETATCVVDCTNENVRLATMLCEDHVIVLPVSALKNTSYEVEQAVEALQKDAPRFISFISGASRTADIERVLALGVHGPLQLHVLLLAE